MSQSRPLLNRPIDEQEFEELVDPRLTGDYDDVEMFCMIEAAVACIRHSAARRPKMGQVRAFGRGRRTSSNLATPILAIDLFRLGLRCRSLG